MRVERTPPLYETEGNSPSDISDISETVHPIDSANNKWTTLKPKCRKKVSCKNCGGEQCILYCRSQLI
jgi:hypothetical protein